MANLQAWECTRCERNGSITYETGADLWSVARAVLDDHANTSPDCTGDMNTIRVHQPVKDPRRNSGDS